MLPSEAADDIAIKNLIAKTTGKKFSSITGYHIQKKSIDARSKTIWINLTVNAFIDEPFHRRELEHVNFKDVSKAEKKNSHCWCRASGVVCFIAINRTWRSTHHS